MNEKKRKPVAVCTRCRAFSYHLQQVNLSCYHKPDGKKKCKGVFGSAIGVSDWEECSDCSGTGEHREAKCVLCSGVGWHYVRPSF